MSDDWVHFIPADPMFIPESEATVHDALELVRAAFPSADDVYVERHDSPSFYDVGSNWSGVRCSACDVDLEDTWPEQMNTWYETKELVFVTPCCRTRLSLNDLKYPWLCGFARFSFSARNANAANVPADMLKALSALLKTDLRIVRQHI